MSLRPHPFSSVVDLGLKDSKDSLPGPAISVTTALSHCTPCGGHVLAGHGEGVWVLFWVEKLRLPQLPRLSRGPSKQASFTAGTRTCDLKHCPVVELAEGHLGPSVEGSWEKGEGALSLAAGWGQEQDVACSEQRPLVLEAFGRNGGQCSTWAPGGAGPRVSRVWVPVRCALGSGAGSQCLAVEEAGSSWWA